MADELFQLSNGRYITSEEITEKCSTSSPYTLNCPIGKQHWVFLDEAGMADLFSECYAQDTRFCRKQSPGTPMTAASGRRTWAHCW
jgi:putative DNA primase/helicase